VTFWELGVGNLASLTFDLEKKSRNINEEKCLIKCAIIVGKRGGVMYRN